MTVTELRKLLVHVPGKVEVILSCDSEGNRFHKLDNLNHLVDIKEDFVSATVRKETKIVLLWPDHEEIQH